MAYKTTVECATYNKVGFSRIDRNYTVDDEVYETRVALYRSDGTTFVKMDEYRTCQLSGLSSSTSYVLKSVYVEWDDDNQEYVILGVIPDTEVSFTTKMAADYKPIVSLNDGVISVSALSDSYWMPEQQGINGFGVGVEVYNSSNTVVASSYITPCSFNNMQDESYTIKAYNWTGTASSQTKVNNITGAETVVEKAPAAETVVGFAYPEINAVELHVLLENFQQIDSITVNIYKDGASSTLDVIEIPEPEGGFTNNKVYVVRVDELIGGDVYAFEVEAESDGSIFSSEVKGFIPKERYNGRENTDSGQFKDFWIAVGQPGAYSSAMKYTEVFGMNERFGIKIKHAPYSPMSKVKNMVVQSWKDENGDDVWLPRAVGSTPGTYNPAITHQSVDYSAKFVIYGNSEVVNSNQVIREVINAIEGRWLKIYDEYTQMGFDGVYLEDVDDDPKFRRRSYDYVEFELKFKINGVNIDEPFVGIDEMSDYEPLEIEGERLVLNNVEVEDNNLALDNVEVDANGNLVL